MWGVFGKLALQHRKLIQVSGEVKDPTGDSMLFLKLQMSLFIFLLSCFFVQANENQEELNRRLHEAVFNTMWSAGGKQEGEEGTIENIQRLLDAGADINSRNEDGYHVLGWQLNWQLHDFLLQNGADTYAKFPGDKDEKTYFHSETSPVKIRSHIEAEADPNIRDGKGKTPLHYNYLSSRKIERAEVLLEAGADPNAIDELGRTPLHYVGPNDFKTARYLIKNGADRNIRDKEGKLPDVVIAMNEVVERQRELMSQNRVCRYITEEPPVHIQTTQCGNRRVCMTEVICAFEVGMDPNKTEIERRFQATCFSFSNGQCPAASDCVLDRSVVEAQVTENSLLPVSSPSRSTRATR